MNEVYRVWHHSCETSQCAFSLKENERCPSCGQGEVEYVSVLKEEYDRLVLYERVTRDTICWGVHCVHEASALNLVAEADERRERAFEVLRLAAMKSCRNGEAEIHAGMVNCSREDCVACRARRILGEKT